MPLMEPGSILTRDCAYNDFDRLYRTHRIPAFFVVRTKKNLRYCRAKPIDRRTRPPGCAATS